MMKLPRNTQNVSASNELPTIAQCSPSFCGVLLRRFSCLSELAAFDALFSVVMQYGGGSELDFVREDGASYNPRPARIGMILLLDCEISSTELLSVGLGAALPEVHRHHVVRQLNEHQRSLLESIALHEAGNFDQATPESVVISGAILLDRLRHLHIGEKQKRQIPWGAWREAARATVFRLNEHPSPRLRDLLAGWLRRNEWRWAEGK